MKTDADKIDENVPGKMTVDQAMKESDVDCELDDEDLAEFMD